MWSTCFHYWSFRINSNCGKKVSPIRVEILGIYVYIYFNTTLSLTHSNMSTPKKSVRKAYTVGKKAYTVWKKTYTNFDRILSKILIFDWILTKNSDFQQNYNIWNSDFCSKLLKLPKYLLLSWCWEPSSVINDVSRFAVISLIYPLDSLLG